MRRGGHVVVGVRREINRATRAQKVGKREIKERQIESGASDVRVWRIEIDAFLLRLQILSLPSTPSLCPALVSHTLVFVCVHNFLPSDAQNPPKAKDLGESDDSTIIGTTPSTTSNMVSGVHGGRTGCRGSRMERKCEHVSFIPVPRALILCLCGCHCPS